MNHDNSILHYFSPHLGVCHMKCTRKSLTLTCYNEKLQKEYQYKIRLILTYLPDYPIDEVPDPYYGGEDGFDQVLDILEEAIEALYEDIS